MSGGINIPVEDLKDTIARLTEIRSRIEEKTGLERAGTENDIGDSGLIEAVTSFDSAWKAGHERVQENVDAFGQAAQGIVDNFEQADTEIHASLDEGT
ncbi:hypothetical protein [Streptomyces sp. NPDC048603]|uniref:hypothetical protein n=1 Tax=Streptomyces sp. NPDC048603 TaxID=3365577 RepID=UPI00372440BB